MGVISRRQTWHEGYKQYYPKSFLPSEAKGKSRHGQLRTPHNSVRDLPYSGFKRKQSGKLETIWDASERDDGLDCKDIVRMIEYAKVEDSENETSRARIAKSTKALLDFSSRQQSIIKALQLQNRALQQSNDAHVENVQIQAEMNSVVQCALQVTYSKLHGILDNIQRGESSEVIPSTNIDIQKMHKAMERVLSCTQLVMQKNKDAKDFQSYEKKTSANHHLIIDDYSSDIDLLSPLRKDSFSDKRNGKRTGLEGKARRGFGAKLKLFFSSCFRPSEALQQRPETEEEKVFASLEECKDLLRSFAWKYADARGPGHASNGMLDNTTLRREVQLLSELPNNALNTINTLLHKSECYTIDVVNKLLCECRDLQGELQKKYGQERELLGALDEMNLKILTSENKACQVAMEMLLMSEDQPTLNPWS